ncbi:MAG: DNA polymerase III subunit delta [Thermoanaerobaculia bacterium]
MLTTESELLRAIDSGSVPPLVLIGGDNEYLVERAFRAVRDRVLERDPAAAVESFPPGADLATVLDSFRTHSLFSGSRILILPEVHAFVSRKETSGLLDKALGDWKTAKTDRKRSSAMAKLLHVLGLAAVDVSESDDAIAEALGLRKADGALADMLALARGTGKKATRGEDDAALLAEAAAQGGAPGTVLLMRTGEIPSGSATIDAIARRGAVVVCNLGRADFDAALGEAIAEIASVSGVRVDAAAVDELKKRLGIGRVLGDKFSREIPDLRLAIGEIDRLATFAGSGGRITRELVAQQVAEVAGGMRWELGSLFAEGKTLEAIAKLRELVAQGAREEGRGGEEIQYGRYLFAIAEEIRQLLGIHSWARRKGLDLRRGIPYNRFKDGLADELGEFLKTNRLARQKPHPFALHKRFEAARLHREEDLLASLDRIAELEFQRKSGGVPVDVGLETIILASRSR